MTSRAGGLLDMLFVCLIKNFTEEEPGVDPAVIPADGVPGN